MMTLYEEHIRHPFDEGPSRKQVHEQIRQERPSAREKDFPILISWRFSCPSSALLEEGWERMGSKASGRKRSRACYNRFAPPLHLFQNKHIIAAGDILTYRPSTFPQAERRTIMLAPEHNIGCPFSAASIVSDWMAAYSSVSNSLK